MLPYQNIIKIDREAQFPIYLQITNQLVKLIQNGQLPSGAKLPSSRTFAKLFALNRNTIMRALEELEALGWINISPKKGAFVVKCFPILRANNWSEKERNSFFNTKQRFEFYDFPGLKKPTNYNRSFGFDEGVPDIRLAPTDELARTYAKNLRQLAFEKNLNYNDGLGNINLRKQLVKMLNETRGLNITLENIFITQGTIMAIHLAILSLIRAGDKAIIGESNYNGINILVKQYGGELLSIPVDEKGIVVSAIPELCEKHSVRALYVTPHHHYPTTVTLSPERRIQLIRLAKRYNFVILEDDYDYDFHFDHSPVLPLASSDNKDLVLYFGSFTKIIAPAFRIGYLIGPSRLIQSLPKLRRIFDRQGDIIMEQTMADLIKNGTIRRHLKKSLQQYRERRDFCCDLFDQELGNNIQFQKPTGGMAIWTIFDKKINLALLSKKMRQKGIYLSSEKNCYSKGEYVNGTRMGFASMNLEEMEQSVRVLKGVLDKFI